ncbi:ATP-binding protein [Bacillus sp. 1P10SD]|uniref:ATP-binding protein n=1 Tax=Bacillus sp. 1P10SD TaxID=3132265 RepID=UPI0039A458B5
MIGKVYLEEVAFSKIGNVVEVSGRKITIIIDSDKNLSNLFFKGKIYRNVGIGSYLKIKKDYVYIIVKIDKEFIKEKTIIREQYKPNNSTVHDRFVEASVIGFINNKRFIRGVRELPFLYNEVFLMAEEEVREIYNVNSNSSITQKVSIGSALFDDVEVEADVSKLFASHIGIFGNTGSGKSNTLARIYYNLFQLGLNFNNKSKFVLVDFNGEYSHDEVITHQKENIILSTRTPHNKLKIKNSWLDDEFWAIILEATEKTQKPFLKRTLNYIEYLRKDENIQTVRHIINTLVSKFKNILNKNGIGNKELDALSVLKTCICDFFNLNENDEHIEILRSYNLHNNTLCRERNIVNDNTHGYIVNGNGNIYFGPHNVNNINIESQRFKEKLDSMLTEATNAFSYLKFFEVTLGLKLVDDVLKSFVQFEHISPLFTRFNKRKNELNKVLEFSEVGFTASSLEGNLICISLRDVNLDMRKIIPMLITKTAYEEHKATHNNNGQTLHLIIDEAHNILSSNSFRESESWKDYRLEVFEEIIKEGRKFGVFLTISSQRPSDITNTIISQLHNVFIHRLINNNDLLTMSKTISFLDQVSFESIPILPPGGCIFTGIATDSPIAIQIPILNNGLQPKSQTVDLTELWNN